MKTALLLIAFACAACGSPKAPVSEAPPAESPVEQNKAEKYVGGLQADVKAAQDKTDAANKRTDEAQKELQQAEGH